MIGMLRALERFVLPNVCVACDGPVESRAPDALLCGVCRSRMRRLTGGCERCHQPLPPIGPCRFCHDWPNALAWVRSAVWLDEQAREVLHHLKYEGYTALGEALGDIVVRFVDRPPGGVVIPIPLSRRRLRERGYNQASAIACVVARRWSLPLAERLLNKVRDTRSQTAFRPQDRLRNISGAFAAVSPAAAVSVSAAAAASAAPAVSAAPPPGRGDGVAVILIDDVLTTGATVVAAATALAEAGWPRIGAVTFARALPYLLRVTS